MNKDEWEKIRGKEKSGVSFYAIKCKGCKELIDSTARRCLWCWESVGYTRYKKRYKVVRHNLVKLRRTD